MFLSKVRGTYYIFFRDENGIRHKASTHSRNKADAIRFVQEFKWKRIEPSAPKDKLKQIQISIFINEYFEYAKSVLTAKTISTYELAFKEFIRVEGDLFLDDVGVKHIEHFLSVKITEASEWTARKYYIALAAAFQKAVHWEYLTANPFRKVAKPKTREVLPTFFTQDDFALFLTAAKDADFRDFCTTAILSGLRLGELLALTWKDVDFDTKIILVQNSESFTTKSKRSRVVPMNVDLAALLLERKRNQRSESNLVFSDARGRPIKQSTIQHMFKKTVRRVPLNDKLHFHSLRHSFASALVMAGVSLYAVQKLLGHTTSKTTEIYAHLQPQQLHSEVNRGLEGFCKHQVGGTSNSGGEENISEEPSEDISQT